MSDIVKKLRDCGLGIGDFKTERGDFGLCKDAADEIERLRGVLFDVEVLTATGDGLAAGEVMTVHLLAAEGRAHEPQAWRFNPRVVHRVHELVRQEIESIKGEGK